MRRRSESPGASMRLSNPERVIDATTGLTKVELVRYYATVSPPMLERLTARPVSLVRAQQVSQAGCFFRSTWTKVPSPGGELPACLPRAMSPCWRCHNTKDSQLPPR